MNFEWIGVFRCGFQQSLSHKNFFYLKCLVKNLFLPFHLILKVHLQSQFQRFLNQILCVFSKMEDIKHIRRDLHSVPWVMPQGCDLGVQGVCVCGGGGLSKFIFSEIQPISWGLGERPKGQISLNFNYKANYKYK